MATLQAARFTDFKGVQERITTAIAGARSFEEAAQQYATALYENFRESCVLVRHFVTVPYAQLPADNARFVAQLADAKQVQHLLRPETLVLSLVGTAGAKPEWNDRKRSTGHVGIPLVSAAFIDAIPMMSRLLKELGLGLDWIDRGDTTMAEQTLGLMSGLFFVPEAKREVDTRGRKIIAAQDFVAAHKIRAVFGFGGGYLGTRSMTVTIIFLRDSVEKRQADMFASAMARFRTMTGELVKTRIFTTS